MQLRAPANVLDYGNVIVYVSATPGHSLIDLMEWVDDTDAISYHEIIHVPVLPSYMTFSRLIADGRILQQRPFQTQRYRHLDGGQLGGDDIDVDDDEADPKYSWTKNLLQLLDYKYLFVLNRMSEVENEEEMGHLSTLLTQLNVDRARRDEPEIKFEIHAISKQSVLRKTLLDNSPSPDRFHFIFIRSKQFLNDKCKEVLKQLASEKHLSFPVEYLHLGILYDPELLLEEIQKTWGVSLPRYHIVRSITNNHLKRRELEIQLSKSGWYSKSDDVEQDRRIMLKSMQCYKCNRRIIRSSSSSTSGGAAKH
jgi:hypothetical protein